MHGMYTQNDQKYQKLLEEVRQGKKPKFSVRDDGLLLHQGRMCIPNDVDLRQIILKETHESLFAMHPDGTKMYRGLKEHYWWMRMKRNVAEFVSKYLTCQ